MGCFPLLMYDLNINFKGFKIDLPQIASIVDYNALFSKEIVIDLSFFFEIMIN